MIEQFDTAYTNYSSWKLITDDKITFLFRLVLISGYEFFRSEPEYYDLVTKPIDMLKIQHKLKNDEYEDIDALSEDVELLVQNAKLYYAVSNLLQK